MHEVRLNITEEIFEKFMGLVDILPKESIKIKEIDSVPFYPNIPFDKAQKKVQNSIENISKNRGRDADAVFTVMNTAISQSKELRY